MALFNREEKGTVKIHYELSVQLAGLKTVSKTFAEMEQKLFL